VGVFGEEVFGAGVEVGEVAAASSGDEDFFSGFIGVVDEEDAAVAAAGFDGAEESCSACSEDDYVELVAGGLVLAVCQCHFWVPDYLLRFSRLYQNGIRLGASVMNNMEYFVAKVRRVVYGGSID
jgi:hypothetical protein